MSSGSIPSPRACSPSSLAVFATSGSGFSWRGGQRLRSTSLSISHVRCRRAASGGSVWSRSGSSELDRCWSLALDARRPSSCSSAFMRDPVATRSSPSRSEGDESAGRCLERLGDDDVPIPASLHDLSGVAWRACLQTPARRRRSRRRCRGPQWRSSTLSWATRGSAGGCREGRDRRAERRAGAFYASAARLGRVHGDPVGAQARLAWSPGRDPR